MEQSKANLHQVGTEAMVDKKGELHSTEVAFLLLTQQPGVRYSALPRIYLLMLLRFIDSTAKNSGQRLDKANGTHLVLTCGKLVLTKKKTRYNPKIFL